MTVTLPVNGRADWTNYVDYWRDEDATWLEDRIILRAGNNAERNSMGITVGGVVYNNTKKLLELKLGTGNTDADFLTLQTFPAMLKVTEDTGLGITTISHTGAANKGIVYSASQMAITNKLVVLNGVLTVDTPGVTIKVGSNKAVLLSTNASSLVSDSRIEAPGVTITGGGTIDAAGKTATVGPLTAGSVTASSGTVSGAWNAASGTIGGVVLASNRATAYSGFLSQSGLFYGDSNGAVMRHSNQTGPYVQTNATVLNVSGSGTCDFYIVPRLVNIGAIQHWNTGKNIAPSFYSATTPDAASYADGTIWVQ